MSPSLHAQRVKSLKSSKSSLRKYYERQADTEDHQERMYCGLDPWDRYRHVMMRDFLMGAIADELNSGSVFLEVGCAEGLYVAGAAKMGGYAVGLDIAHSYVAKAKIRCQGDAITAGSGFVVGDAEHLPFRDKAADVVLASELLEHLTDPAAALKEMARVSTGSVVVSAPTEENVIVRVVRALTGVDLRRRQMDRRVRDGSWNPEHVSLVDTGSIILTLEGSGFRLRGVRGVMIGLPAPMRLTRLLPSFLIFPVRLLDRFLSLIPWVNLTGKTSIILCRRSRSGKG